MCAIYKQVLKSARFFWTMSVPTRYPHAICLWFLYVFCTWMAAKDALKDALKCARTSERAAQVERQKAIAAIQAAEPCRLFLRAEENMNLKNWQANKSGRVTHPKS